MGEFVVPTRAWALEHKSSRIPSPMWAQFVDLRLRPDMVELARKNSAAKRSHKSLEVRRSCGLEGLSWQKNGGGCHLEVSCMLSPTRGRTTLTPILKCLRFWSTPVIPPSQ
ncbi:hypothetical protein LINPERPRIM_LOCUS41250 [Linum perenne]